MELSFWDTRLGQELAETLIRELPKLTRKRKQYTERLSGKEVIPYLEKELANGKRFVTYMRDPRSYDYIVFMEENDE